MTIAKTGVHLLPVNEEVKSNCLTPQSCTATLTFYSYARWHPRSGHPACCCFSDATVRGRDRDDLIAEYWLCIVMRTTGPLIDVVFGYYTMAN